MDINAALVINAVSPLFFTILYTSSVYYILSFIFTYNGVRTALYMYEYMNLYELVDGDYHCQIARAQISCRGHIYISAKWSLVKLYTARTSFEAL